MTRISPLLLTGIIAAALVSAPRPAQGADRDLLRGRLILLYVSNPNVNPRQAPQELDNDAIAQGTENGAFWSNASVRGLHRLVRALLRDQTGGGDTTLQYYAARVLNIQNKLVTVFLLDDVSQGLAATAETNYHACIESGHAWPCATSYQNHATHAGRIVLGAYYFQAVAGANPSRSDLADTFGTFLHELVHTQDLTDGRAHLFWFNGYGMDGQHYSVEVMPNTAMTYTEGIANCVRLLYDGAQETYFFNRWFAPNGLLWVEKAEPPAGSALSPDAWLYTQLTKAGVAQETLTAAERANWVADLVANYAPYRIRSLPARFIIKNEYIMALILTEYIRHVDPARFYNALRVVNQRLAQASGSGVAVLFEEMCKAGLPVGSTLESVSVSGTGNGPKGYLLPLAYADYFTAYRSGDNKATYASLLEDRMPSGWIDLYWANKDVVRKAVTLPGGRTPQFADLTNIAVALGLTQSVPD